MINVFFKFASYTGTAISFLHQYPKHLKNKLYKSEKAGLFIMNAGTLLLSIQYLRLGFTTKSIIFKYIFITCAFIFVFLLISFLSMLLYRIKPNKNYKPKTYISDGTKLISKLSPFLTKENRNKLDKKFQEFYNTVETLSLFNKKNKCFNVNDYSDLYRTSEKDVYTDKNKLEDFFVKPIDEIIDGFKEIEFLNKQGKFIYNRISCNYIHLAIVTAKLEVSKCVIFESDDYKNVNHLYYKKFFTQGFEYDNSTSHRRRVFNNDEDLNNYQEFYDSLSFLDNL
ncbi:hypothetical protein OD91_2242 [Lutibacter sp. Hel_I_33_5]|uniref:hypothetical protein n=1 Tax=Lutibacter sp. Hel_I_33_5 TaxID=1566289 RepID=UPI0011A66297|nr:hypothetical protein [Lutibacter sp. Hel_I_33_5]TVZ56940.1 hypothetical protein OD91_2242 [Lutibacter sp. Hel_I_33_5]